MIPSVRNIVIVIIDVLLAVYVVLAATAFNKPWPKDTVCTNVSINISDGGSNGFLSAGEIQTILEKRGLYPLRQKMASIDTRSIEEALKRSPFVDGAQCYKTSGGHVNIELNQRMPVIRVKAANGDDYYVDNHGGVMPNTRYVSDIIIATGAISREYASKVLTRIANHIMNDGFWQNQVVQINVLNDGSMEIVPRVGNHIIYLGEPVGVQKKLQRMEKFYRYGLNRVGWNKYSYISVEFDNQIICKKKQDNNNTDNN